MTKKISRRELFRDVGKAGAAGLLASTGAAGAPQTPFPAASTTQLLSLPSTQLLEQFGDYHIQITAGEMEVTFDRRYGALYSITIALPGRLYHGSFLFARVPPHPSY